MILGSILFCLIWWTVIFTTLPFGVKMADKVTTGHAGSAPVRHNMPRKIVATTIISILLWLPLYPMAQALLDKMRENARQMALDDERREHESQAEKSAPRP